MSHPVLKRFSSLSKVTSSTTRRNICVKYIAKKILNVIVIFTTSRWPTCLSNCIIQRPPSTITYHTCFYTWSWNIIELEMLCFWFLKFKWKYLTFIVTKDHKSTQSIHQVCIYILCINSAYPARISCRQFRCSLRSF